MNKLHHQFPLPPRSSGILHYPAQIGRGQAGRLWAGKFEYLSARLLPSVVLNIQKHLEIPFVVLYPRSLLHSVKRPWVAQRNIV